ncbi:phosphate ABC transporter substrate-binding protein [Simiduia aestuariiviva]|uniref:ABC-type phosphate transport system substrate-binding protein n=1 Tax=Simiduia aestuariiviva TaxID=1510459 RepID=A0A839UJI5_9GAMM|nr:phosphate ABC transporter substrate-binding protein [Simiduia aestuariiviva]MBB3168022.1 ABC-type phosphate transport system substrate-binding protein [Simiduia aestuariiviva]
MSQFFSKKIASRLVFAATVLLSCAAWSGVAVVVHPANPNAMDENDISRVFLGKKKSFPDGSEAIPVDQADGSANRSAFVSTILKKNEQQIKAYWAQLLFTGKGTPPKEVGSSADVKKLIAQNPSLIGYIDTADVDASVKVLYEF